MVYVHMHAFTSMIVLLALPPGYSMVYVHVHAFTSMFVLLAIPPGSSMVYVHVHAFNTGAIRLYKELGFKVGTGMGRGNGDGGDEAEYVLPVDATVNCNAIVLSA